MEPAQRHLALFLADVRAQAPVPTLRSFLKLYTSLDAKKLSNFLDADEEEMVQQLMVMKQASRSISRVDNEKGFMGGQMISTSDLDFVIDEVGYVLDMVRLVSCLTQDRSRRIWSTLPSRRWEDAMRVGSSGTQNTLSASMIHFTTAHYLFQRRLLLSRPSPMLLLPHPRRRKRWLGELRRQRRDCAIRVYCRMYRFSMVEVLYSSPCRPDFLHSCESDSEDL